MSLMEKYDEILNEVTREAFEYPEVKRFYEIKLNQKRAQIIAQQFGLFVRHRRSAWAYVLARCPVREVKQELIKHETEELLHDPRCGCDHYTLWVIHGKAVGLTEDDVHNAEPLPSTRAALCGWIYLGSHLPWLEGLGGVSVLERTNLDPIIPGGAHQTRAQKRWIEDLGLKEDQIPNFRIHREADTAHKGQTMGLLARYATSEVQWEGIVEAAKQSFDFWKVFIGGVARAMEEAR